MAITRMAIAREIPPQAARTAPRNEAHHRGRSFGKTGMSQRSLPETVWLHRPSQPSPCAWGVSSLDRPKERNIQKRLTRLAGIGVNLPQELMPARIAVDLAVVGNSALDCRIEIASRLYRQAPLKLDVLGFKVLQMRRDGMQCCALGNVDQLRAIILHVLVSHNFVAASEQ